MSSGKGQQFCSSDTLNLATRNTEGSTTKNRTYTGYSEICIKQYLNNTVQTETKHEWKSRRETNRKQNRGNRK